MSEIGNLHAGASGRVSHLATEKECLFRFVKHIHIQLGLMLASGIPVLLSVFIDEEIQAHEKCQQAAVLGPNPALDPVP